MLLALPLLLIGCDAENWCTRFNLACELKGEEEEPDIVDSDGDVWPDGEDCAPNDPERHPSAEEICDGRDNDCDGEIDEGTPGIQTWYADLDGDGYGDDDVTVEACDPPTDFISVGGDCDDGYYYQNPSRAEICENARDDDCSGDAAGCLLDGDLDESGPEVQVRASGQVSSLGAVLMATRTSTVGGPGDLWLAAPEASGELAAHGRAAGILGASAALVPSGEIIFEQTDLQIRGGAEGMALGSALAGGLDLDGNGAFELFVGAPGDGGDGAGAAFLYSPEPGRLGELSPRDVTVAVQGTEPGHGLGAALAMTEQADEDGLVALVVGIPGGASGLGEVALFLGELQRALEPGDAELRLRGDEAGSGLGTVLAMSDLDGDGLDDLVLSEPTREAGLVRVHFAPFPTGIGHADEAEATLVGEAEGDRAGASLGVGGDVDGDGLLDLLVGGPGSDTAGEEAGSAWLLLGGEQVDRDTGRASLATAQARLDGESAGDEAGTAVALSGDVDGDDRDDMLIGGPGHDEARGRAWLVAGELLTSRDLSAATAWTNGTLAGSRSGAAVAFLVDADGNGLDEVVVGAPGEDDGRVRIFAPEPQ